MNRKERFQIAPSTSSSKKKENNNNWKQSGEASIPRRWKQIKRSYEIRLPKRWELKFEDSITKRMYERTDRQADERTDEWTCNANKMIIRSIQTTTAMANTEIFSSEVSKKQLNANIFVGYKIYWKYAQCLDTATGLRIIQSYFKLPRDSYDYYLPFAGSGSGQQSLYSWSWYCTMCKSEDNRSILSRVIVRNNQSDRHI